MPPCLRCDASMTTMGDSMKRTSLLIVLILLRNCASPPKNQRSIGQIWPDQLRVRRPLAAGATADTDAGGLDYTSRPLPNEKLDCESYEALFQKVDFKALRQCFADQTAVKDLDYRLQRLPAPELELMDPEDAPTCIQKLLPSIPVPREIIFRAEEPTDAKPRCWSSRINIEADEILGVKLPGSALALHVGFPLVTVPQDDAEMKRLLGSWALTPFFRDLPGGANGRLRSQIVPDRLCDQCMGALRDTYHPPQGVSPIWP